LRCTPGAADHPAKAGLRGPHRRKELDMKSFTGMAAWTRSLIALLLVSVSTIALAASVEQDQAKIRKQSQDVLARLYQAQPSARAVIANAKGYATFSKWGLTIGAVGGGIGRGLAVTQPSGKETFMRYVEGSAGIGLGIKKYALIFVFETEQARSDFINKGWEGGAQATAAAKHGSSGNAYEGAASVSPGVWVYQVTDKGLAAEIGLKGTKYYQDTALN
jgi:lipid-binding SYLF domain-containing protein